MSHHHEIENPGPLKVSSKLNTFIFAAMVIGTIGTIAGAVVDPKHFWPSLLINHFYFMGLALGGLFIAAIQFTTGAMWSAPIRRISESFSAYLPAVLGFFILIVLGAHSIFEWTNPEFVKGDVVLEHKAGYLNLPFFIIRNIVAIVAWMILSRKMVGNSVAQDKDGDLKYSLKNKVVAPFFLAIFAITFTMTAFDLMMSLDPHWFSTMFGVYCFAGAFYGALALTAILTILLKRAGYLKLVNENHLHDLGKFMFAFTVFWAYIAFCQFMLIWYANLPEETMYFMHRMKGSWMFVTIFLLVGKFMVPFFSLLTRKAKRTESRLLKVGIFMLIAQWIDVFWLVQPEFQPDGFNYSGIWIDLFGFVALAGVFAFLVTRFLSKNNVMAIKDPKIHESLFNHHQ